MAGSFLGCADQGPSILPPNVSRSSVSTCASPCTRTCVPAAICQQTSRSTRSSAMAVQSQVPRAAAEQRRVHSLGLHTKHGSIFRP